MVEGQREVLVTLEGECFAAQFEDKRRPHNRDGVLYYFLLEDMVSARGTRLVSLGVYGPVRITIKNFGARLELVCWNVIRRAFDQHVLGFEDQPADPHTYHEIHLEAEDFDNQRKPIPDSEIRSFIMHKAYWRGYRYSDDPHKYFLDFAVELDLDYLGVTKADIKRNVWLMVEQGLLQSTDFPETGKPTHKLVELYESNKVIELPGEKVFLKGSQYDSYKAILEILRLAKAAVVIVDRYVGTTILDMLASLAPEVQVRILTEKPSPDFALALRKFKEQYSRPIEVRRKRDLMHDRVLIVDQTRFYSPGASLKDAGRRLWILHGLEDPKAISALRRDIDLNWESASPL